MRCRTSLASDKCCECCLVALRLRHGRVLRLLGDAELEDALRRDLGLGAVGRVAADAGLAVDDHEIATSQDLEAALVFLVREDVELVAPFARLPLPESVLF